MNKKSWKMNTFIATAVVASLFAGGQAYAAEDGQQYNTTHHHQFVNNKTNAATADQTYTQDSSDDMNFDSFFQGYSPQANNIELKAPQNNAAQVTVPHASRQQATAPRTSNSEYSQIGEQVIKAGEKYLGTPYQYGASRFSKATMDCSSFTMWAFKEGAGIDLGRGGARSQYKKGTPISRSELKVGDLVFFSTPKTMKYPADSINRIGHIGIYAGNNKVLHTFGKGGVTYSNMGSGWWDTHYVGAVRVIK